MTSIRRAGVLSIASLVATGTIVEPADACDPYERPNRIAGAFSARWGTVEWEPTYRRASAPCPEPPCPPITVCETFEENTVFVRPDEHLASPIFEPGVPGSYCFSIAKVSDSLYYHLHAAPADETTGDPAGFRFSTSPDGIGWTPGNLAFPAAGTWYPSIICPDVHHDEETGEMYLYFQGAGAGIGYATSSNGGRTFVDSGAPVLVSDDPEFIVRTPSVSKLGDTYYMVYNKVCLGEGAPFVLATLNLATSTDRVNWTPSENNPIVVPGECGSYDVGTTALGQLVADRDGQTLHLFYTGTGWFETPSGGTTRGCAKVAHALSTDLGQSWCKTGSPVLDHPPAGSGAWDDGQYYVTDYTWETGADDDDVLRMYYWGEGSTFGQGLGVAEAPANDLPECSTIAVGGSAGATPSVAPVRLTLHPNPTSGAVVASFALEWNLNGSASVEAYDLQGRRVREIWSGDIGALPADVSWDRITDDGRIASAGRYLIRLQLNGETLAASWTTIVR